MLDSTQDRQFVQGQSGDVPNHELLPDNNLWSPNQSNSVRQYNLINL